MGRKKRQWFKARSPGRKFCIRNFFSPPLASDIVSGANLPSMLDNQYLRIGEVVERTGLSVRMIRHYESKKLIAPVRSGSGQRLYNAEDLSRLALIQMLKRAGMGLQSIAQWMQEGVDARSLIAGELELQRTELKRITHAVSVLETVRAEMVGNEPLEIAQLTKIFKSTMPVTSEEAAEAFFKRHFSPEDKAGWETLVERLRKEVDPEEHESAWRALATDIQNGMALDPASKEAQALLARWEALLEPFKRVASERQQEIARTMWSNVDAWGDAHKQAVNSDIVDFISRARAASKKEIKE